MLNVELLGAPVEGGFAAMMEGGMRDLRRSTRIGDILVEQRIISRAQLLEALDLQQARSLLSASPESSNEIGEILIELGFVSRAQLKQNLARQSRLRKTTLAFTLVAPLFTMACGGGGGANANAAPAKPVSSTPSSVLLVTSSKASAASTPGETGSSSATSSGGNAENVTGESHVSSDPAGNGAIAQSSEATTSASGALQPGTPSSAASSSTISAPPSSSYSSTKTSSCSSSLRSSSSSSLRSSSSASSTSAVSSSLSSRPISSVSSSAVSSEPIDGPVVLYWTAPTRRENGAHLDISQVGGYEVRYKLRSQNQYTYVTIPDGYTDAYYFDYLKGDYEFEIAAFDINGLYSQFVRINPVE